MYFNSASIADTNIDWYAAQNTLATRYNLVFINPGTEAVPNPSTTMLGAPLLGRLIGIASDLKAINPACKVGIYAGGIASPDSHHPDFEWLSDADRLHTTPGGVAVEINNPPSERKRLINLSRAATRAKLVNMWDAWLTKNNMDGILFDSVDPRFYSAYASFFGVGSGALEGAVNTSVWWSGPIYNYLKELKDRLARKGKVVYANGIFPDPAYDANDPVSESMGRHNANLGNFGTGAFAEHVHRMYSSTQQFGFYLEVFSRMNLMGIPFIFLFMPWLFATTDVGLVWTENTALRRYALCCYLLVKSSVSYFGYNAVAAYLGYDASNQVQVFDSPDWDLSIGSPTSDVLTNTSGATTVYYRKYTLGTQDIYTVVNPHASSAGNFGVAGTYKDFNAGADVVVTTTVSIPARTARLYFKVA